MRVTRAYYALQLIRSRMRLSFLKFVYGSRLEIGKSVGVRRGFVVNMSGAHAMLRIGSSCSFNNFCSLNVRHSLSIGDDCIIGEGVRFYDHDHVFAARETPIRKQGFLTKGIVLEDNCWLGSNVTVLKGVVVGANTIVGAGVTLTKSVPPNSVVIGRQDIEVRQRPSAPTGTDDTRGQGSGS